MALTIDTHDIDMLADIFRRRSAWLVPSAVIKGQRRAEKHVRKRRHRIEGHRHYRRHRVPVPTANLVAHYINHILFLKFKMFWGRKVGRF